MTRAVAEATGAATGERRARGARPARRRQARGERRMAQILDAAAAVFAEHGFEAATTVRISAEAGISPGSLYQFFPNKEAIAEALARRFAEGLRGALAAAFGEADPAGATPSADAARTAALASGDLVAAVDRVVDPFLAFALEHPGFEALFARTDQPPGLLAVTGPLHEVVLAGVTTAVRRRAPGLTAPEAELAARVAAQLFKALVPLAAAAGTEAERAAVVRELKRALIGYFTQLGPA
ncbi:TetR/AcrR family transcriptional regulator [Streptomyces sp. DSM 44917]|uniref:TetR/AcrR family transcriptional regulator n=1 Tax=Streptomyces boetiae TaxID=3075541 RepID=A0ABU2L5S3_9ACTN|nr:TetR/AcrR family transcriptional regulator [Streptomyces sp. DSM 44917]MDT0306578.1 TetR/AcrR family transcriptional regulator [Streptomyces sp. DSM 44917]